MINEFKVLKDVVTRLNKNKIPYMLSGSIAMNYYSEPRMTRDIDIVIEIESAKKFYNLFKKNFYVDLEMIKNSILNKKMFNIIHLGEIIKIDFMVRKDSEFRKTEFSRRRKVKIGNLEIFIVSIEDLVLSKLIWAKDSHSEIQLKDVKNLLGEKVDTEYIKKWADALLINNLLNEVLGKQNGQ